MLESFIVLDKNKQQAVMFSILYEILCNTKNRRYLSRKIIDKMIIFLQEGTIKEYIAEILNK